MSSDWTTVFGEGIMVTLTTPAAKLLSGLNPCFEKDRIKFGRHIGILKQGVDRLGDYLGRPFNELDLISDDDDDDAEHGESIGTDPKQVKKAPKKFFTPANPDWQKHIAGGIEKRMRFYLKWLALQRPLVMPSQITANKSVYRLWNLLLSVVSSFLYSRN